MGVGAGRGGVGTEGRGVPGGWGRDGRTGGGVYPGGGLKCPLGSVYVVGLFPTYE